MLNPPTPPSELNYKPEQYCPVPQINKEEILDDSKSHQTNAPLEDRVKTPIQKNKPIISKAKQIPIKSEEPLEYSPQREKKKVEIKSVPAQPKVVPSKVIPKLDKTKETAKIQAAKQQKLTKKEDPIQTPIKIRSNQNGVVSDFTNQRSPILTSEKIVSFRPIVEESKSNELISPVLDTNPTQPPENTTGGLRKFKTQSENNKPAINSINPNHIKVEGGLPIDSDSCKSRLLKINHLYENDSFIASAEEEDEMEESPVNQKSPQKITVASNASKVNIASVKFVRQQRSVGKKEITQRKSPQKSEVRIIKLNEIGKQESTQTAKQSQRGLDLEPNAKMNIHRRNQSNSNSLGAEKGPVLPKIKQGLTPLERGRQSIITISVNNMNKYDMFPVY